ncbi:hypothetical protein GCM10011571_06240 [Marinithermofilum abyssi]|uniref:DUF1572 domain-containing protein n=1 Tax=Marinithermofilum abyssi TaxID=1571185 RepID=A0A8J2VFD4_9BACL|nr:DUF1572 family protein [Marinithermofilum abyssi]GGE07757.1 hypothetical protein GCM10011571_06240 [Marinithermofilum abyssi]
MRLGEEFLQVTIREFEKLKDTGERTMAQLDERELHWRPHAESNSIVVIVQHLAGNMISRWTDFLTSDGEKPDRNREEEFVERSWSREELLRLWEEGWQVTLGTLRSLKTEDLERTVTIRNEPHTVIQAVQRQLAHYAFHVGQMVVLARQIKGATWKTLSIPREGSEAF